MSKYLVTGGAGFIGSNLVDALIKEDHQVTILDNLSTGKTESINKKAKFLEDDIRNRKVWLTIASDYDAIFHTAALARIQPSIKNPIPAHDTNINGTLNVLEYCCKNDVKLVFSSSSSIYEGYIPAFEDSPKKPKNPYALQKYVCEQYIDLYRELYGLNATILRYFNVYGERQLLEGSYATVIGIFLKQKSEGKPLTITNDGEQRRDFTYIGDVVRANIMALKWEGTFNIGKGTNYSINEIASFVGGVREYIGKRSGEVRNTLSQSSKALGNGWVAKVNVEDWIKENV